MHIGKCTKHKTRHSSYLNSKNDLLRVLLRGIKNGMHASLCICVFVAIVNMQMIINYNTLTYANKYATANSTSVADIQKNYLKSVQLYRHCYHCNTLCTRCEWNLWNIHDKYFAFHGGNGGSSGGCGGGSGRLNTIHIIICRDLYEGVVNGRCLLGGVVMLSQKENHNLIIIICMHRSKFWIEKKINSQRQKIAAGISVRNLFEMNAPLKCYTRKTKAVGHFNGGVLVQKQDWFFDNLSAADEHYLVCLRVFEMGPHAMEKLLFKQHHSQRYWIIPLFIINKCICIILWTRLHTDQMTYSTPNYTNGRNIIDANFISSSLHEHI